METEEKRIKTLREAFSLDSGKFSINIGWKGGVYAQMCGHYLHFDCYSSYKKTLEENMNRAVSNIECSCPLCRQVANCVLPIITLSATKQSSATATSAPSSLTHSSLPNSPSKLWILSSLADKQSQLNDMMRYLFIYLFTLKSESWFVL